MPTIEPDLKDCVKSSTAPICVECFIHPTLLSRGLRSTTSLHMPLANQASARSITGKFCRLFSTLELRISSGMNFTLSYGKSVLQISDFIELWIDSSTLFFEHSLSTAAMMEGVLRSLQSCVSYRALEA